MANNISFTLGVCDIGGHSYRFDYASGKYLIFQTDGEQEKQLHVFSDSKEAYGRWNEIKRPERKKRV